MAKTFLDAEAILSINDQWMELEEKWGNPVDLDTEDDQPLRKLEPVLSSLDLRTATFDSSFLLKKVRRKLGRQISNASVLDYKQFTQDLQKRPEKDVQKKDFFYINGEIMSAVSIEDICDQIDDIFRSFDKLCSATSTIREKKKILPQDLPKVVNCSISTTDLSFDDTEMEKTEKSGTAVEDIDKFIDEAFEQLCGTITSCDFKDTCKESVTTLVKKFSQLMKNPIVNRSVRRKKCCDKFQELIEFWNNNALCN